MTPAAQSTAPVATPSRAATAAARLRRAGEVSAEHGVDVLLVTPGTDLQYLLGLEGESHERLTCLVLPASGHLAPPALVVPALEAPKLAGLALDELGVEVVTWTDSEDPYRLVDDLAGGPAHAAVADTMPAVHVFGLRDAFGDVHQSLAGPVLRELRMRKDAAEVAELRAAGAAIDRVHARMAEFLRAGRTEDEAGAAIAAAIVEEGHTAAAFVIVGSGPNGASPHHDLSDRVIGAGEPVVVDIGGTTAAGYCSDCTRNYVAGAAAPDEYVDYFAVLAAAQRAQRDYARPGVSAESVDRTGRAIITEAGLGEAFLHRTGHGIGLETHEEPYIVEGNSLLLEPGMAFSIEPGIYLPGRHGARIEDIVVVTDDGVEVLNSTSRGLVHLH